MKPQSKFNQSEHINVNKSHVTNKSETHDSEMCCEPVQTDMG